MGRAFCDQGGIRMKRKNRKTHRTQTFRLLRWEVQIENLNQEVSRLQADRQGSTDVDNLQEQRCLFEILGFRWITQKVWPGLVEMKFPRSCRFFLLVCTLKPLEGLQDDSLRCFEMESHRPTNVLHESCSHEVAADFLSWRVLPFGKSTLMPGKTYENVHGECRLEE